jgi:hypothetical protein
VPSKVALGAWTFLGEQRACRFPRSKAVLFLVGFNLPGERVSVGEQLDHVSLGRSERATAVTSPATTTSMIA